MKRLLISLIFILALSSVKSYKAFPNNFLLNIPSVQMPEPDSIKTGIMGGNTKNQVTLVKGDTYHNGYFQNTNNEENCPDSIQKVRNFFDYLTEKDKRWVQIVHPNSGNLFEPYTTKILYPLQYRDNLVSVKINTHDLKVGEIQQYSYMACGEPSGGSIGIEVCIRIPQVTVNVIPNPINLIAVVSLGGSMHDICLNWKQPINSLWPIKYLAVVRSDYDTIRYSQLKPGTLANGEIITDSISISDSARILQSGIRGKVPFYAIAGYDNNGELVALSNSLKPTYDLNSFSLLVPADGKMVNTLTPTFEWQSFAQSSYQIWLSTDSSFTNPLIIPGIDTTFFSLQSPLNDNTSYYWKVFASDSIPSNEQAWCFHVSTEIHPSEPFSLMQPQDNSTIHTPWPYLEWQLPNDFVDSLYFQVLISSSQNMSDTMLSLFTRNSFLKLKNENLLPEDTAIYWKVIAFDRNGMYATSNELFTFQIDYNSAPTKFTLYEPTCPNADWTLSGTPNPTFRWGMSHDSDPSDTVRYTLYYSTSGNFEQCDSIASIYDTIYSLSSSLIENQLYYWKVRAYDDHGHSADNFGCPNYFYVDVVDLPPSAFDCPSFSYQYWETKNEFLPSQNLCPANITINYINPEDDLFDYHIFLSEVSDDSTFSNPYIGWGTMICNQNCYPPGDYFVRLKCLSKRIDNSLPLGCSPTTGISYSETVSVSLGDTVWITNARIVAPEISDTTILEASVAYPFMWDYTNVEFVKIEFSYDNCANWELYDDSIPANLGQIQYNNQGPYYGYYLRIPDSISNIHVKVSDIICTNAYDIQNSNIIVIPPVGKELIVTSPLAGTSWKATTTQGVGYESSKVDAVKIEYSLDNGGNWNVIKEKTSQAGISWEIPDITGDNDSCRIKITDFYYPSLFSISDRFSIISCKRIHVSTTGNDITGNGSIITPYKTISRAIIDYEDYDSIRVAAGTYVEKITAPRNKAYYNMFISGGYNPVTWAMDGSGITKLSNPGDTIVNFVGTVYSTFNNIHFEEANIGLLNLGGTKIMNSLLNNLNKAVVLYYSPSTVTLLQSELTNCDIGVFAKDRQCVYLYNSIFKDITSYGIWSNPDGWHTYNRYYIFINNSFINCENPMHINCLLSSYNIPDPWSWFTLKNNIFYSGDIGVNISHIALENINMTNNLFYDFNNTNYLLNDSITQIYDNLNIFADPLIGNLETEQFDLNNGSPCIGAGSINNLTTDFAGNPRPYPPGSNPDIGAYENSLGIPIPTIIGNHSVCQGQNDVPFNVVALANSSRFQWHYTGTGANISNDTMNIVTIDFAADATSGNLYVKGTNSNGNDTIYAILPIIVNPLPAAAGSISGTESVCQGENTVSYSIVPITDATSYAWSYSGISATINNGTTNNITIDFATNATSGNLTVKGLNSCGNGIGSVDYPISVNPLPAAAGIISGTESVCQGENTVSYSIVPITDATSYTWVYSGTGAAIHNGTTNNITVDFATSATSGNLTVKGLNSCGEGICSTNYTISVNPLPDVAGTISGTESVCQGQNDVSFSTPGVTNAISYIWEYSGTGITIHNETTNNITIDFAFDATSGNLTVKGLNSCGEGIGSANYPISINPLPSVAGTISGTESVCQGQNDVSFLVAEVADATSYAWSYSGIGATINNGTANSIMIDFAINATSGNLSVKGLNNCGDGIVSANYPISVNPLPVAAGIISGTESVCQGENTVSYSILPITDATSYSWSYSGIGATINNGTSNSIMIDFAIDATSGDLSVKGLNSCGEGIASTNYPISVNPLPAAAGTISGTGSVCQGANAVPYVIEPISNALNYSWIYSGTGATINNGTSNSITIDFAIDATSGNLIVKGLNNCGEGSGSANYPILVNPIPAAAGTISGTESVCQGQNDVSFLIPEIIDATSYDWTYSGTGATINNGTSNNIMIDFAASATSGNLTVKGLNSCGEGIASTNYPISVNPLPVAAGTISGTESVCQGENTVSYSTLPITDATSYVWSYSGIGATINNGTSNSITIDFATNATSGNLTVKGLNSCGDGIVSVEYPISVNPLPVAAGSISGTESVCQGENAVSFSVPVIEYATSYAWSYSGTGATINNGTSNSITIDFATNATSGNLTVKGLNSCGEGIASTNYPISVNPLPVAAGTITGTESVCQGENTVSYSTLQITDATSYVWSYSGIGATINNGTANSIMIDFAINATSGNLSVKGLNSCGEGLGSASYLISVDPLPAAAGIISGTESVCQGENTVSYSILPITDATSFAWSFSGIGATINNGTTNSITIDFAANATSGNLSVKGLNSCGEGSGSANYPISVNPLPAAAETISGTESVCQGQNDVSFSTPEVTNATSYIWEYSGTGITINNGTSNNIMIDFAANATSGNLSVKGLNSCGEGIGSVNYPISVNPLPAAAGTISGTESVCQGQNAVSYSVNTITDATSYAWVYSGTGATINNGTSNNIMINFAASAISGNLSVKGINNCGEGIGSANYPISVNPLPAAAGTISGTESVCQGQNAVSYSVNTITDATSYAWVYSGTGATINNGTSNNIMIDFAASAISGNLSVKGINNCGEGIGSANYPISVNPLPAAAGTISGTESVCQGENTVSYSILPITNATSYAWSYSGTGATINNETSNSITIDFASNATSGNLTVKGLNACGEGIVSASYSITINFVPLTHNIEIPAGWSGLSSYVIPEIKNIEYIFQLIQNNLVILQTIDAMYFPSQNVNTIGKWRNSPGFKMKVNLSCTLNLIGGGFDDKNLYLNEGWNLMPVICNNPVNTAELFLPVFEDLTVIKEIAGNGVYWPEFNINTLGALIPGKAYFVRMSNIGTITFPPNDCDNLKNVLLPTAIEESSPWGVVYKTPTSHIFALPSNVTDQISEQSFVAAFTPEDVCAGYISKIKSQDQVLVINMDDPLTKEKDGFDVGDPIIFKIWDGSNGNEFTLKVEFDLEQPDHDGFFVDNGISVIKKIQIINNIKDQSLSSILLFPNPTTGKIKIVGIKQGTTLKATLISSTGDNLSSKMLYADDQIDFSNMSKGIYIFKLEDGESIRFEKLILK